MDYAGTLARLRKERGYTQTEAADYLNAHSAKTYSFKNISHWETGVSQPPIEQFLLLCELYGAGDIQGTFRASGSLSSFHHLGKLNALGRSRVEEYIAMLSGSAIFMEPEREAPMPPVAIPASAMSAEPAAPAAIRLPASPPDSGALPMAPLPSRRSIRLYDAPAAAGAGAFLDSDAYEYLDLDEIVPSDADFAVRVSGDSMAPRFVDGQIVFVKEQHILDFGDIGIFSLDNDAYIKKLGYGELISLNPRYAPTPIRDYQSFFIFGKVVG
ncbi:MAG: helix-turn-helix domain-containing protein [Clostridiales bacterium]|nr:helix-turn-helix domain-containing protein [Clostridiales bacterium]